MGRWLPRIQQEQRLLPALHHHYPGLKTFPLEGPGDCFLFLGKGRGAGRLLGYVCEVFLGSRSGLHLPRDGLLHGHLAGEEHLTCWAPSSRGDCFPFCGSGSLQSSAHPLSVGAGKECFRPSTRSQSMTIEWWLEQIKALVPKVTLRGKRSFWGFVLFCFSAPPLPKRVTEVGRKDLERWGSRVGIWRKTSFSPVRESDSFKRPANQMFTQLTICPSLGQGSVQICCCLLNVENFHTTLLFFPLSLSLFFLQLVGLQQSEPILKPSKDFFLMSHGNDLYDECFFFSLEVL